MIVKLISLEEQEFFRQSEHAPSDNRCAWNSLMFDCQPDMKVNVYQVSSFLPPTPWLPISSVVSFPLSSLKALKTVIYLNKSYPLGKKKISLKYKLQLHIRIERKKKKLNSTVSQARPHWLSVLIFSRKATFVFHAIISIRISSRHPSPKQLWGTAAAAG